MGLFSKDSPADKKLKELTGGFIFNKSFRDTLKSNGLSINDGIKINEQLKKEIKQGTVNEHNMESRLFQLIDQYPDYDTSSNIKLKKCPSCLENQDIENKVCVYCGHHFYSPETTKSCPKCNQLQEEQNAFCINCGHEFKEAKKEKKCPICDEMQDEGNNICTSCGYDFVNKRTRPKHKNCPNCGIELFETTNFCINCGYDFERQIMPEDEIACPNCGMKSKKSSDNCPGCGYSFISGGMPETVDKIRQINFLTNYEFNLKTCPDCNTKFLKEDPFCFNCGASVLTKQTVKNDNLEVKDGKLVTKDESGNDELTDLEALYSQTVQSRYAPSFRVAYVLYLKNFRKNPTKKFSERLAKNYDTTPNKLNRQALEDEFIELASPLNAAKDSKVSDLKEILKEHNLKVSGKKDELIERLGENLTDDELKKHFKSKTYQISEKGLKFLSENSYILYIYNNSDISRVFYPSEIGKIFEERQYSEDEIHEIILKYLKRIFDEKLTQELWVDFRIYANAIAEVLEDKNELKDALNMRLKVFLFDINNFSIVSQRPEPKKTKLKQKDMSKLMELMHNLALSIDELKEEFSKAYDEVLFEVEITKEDSLIYLLKIFGGEDLDKISEEINESYSNPH